MRMFPQDGIKSYFTYWRSDKTLVYLKTFYYQAYHYLTKKQSLAFESVQNTNTSNIASAYSFTTQGRLEGYFGSACCST